MRCDSCKSARFSKENSTIGICMEKTTRQGFPYLISREYQRCVGPSIGLEEKKISTVLQNFSYN